MALRTFPRLCLSLGTEPLSWMQDHFIRLHHGKDHKINNTGRVIDCFDRYSSQLVLRNMVGLQILDIPWDHPDGKMLRAAQRVELAARYNTENSEPGSAPTEADIAVFVVAYINERPVACGALRELNVDATTGQKPPGDAEIKRMFVSYESRGRGGVASAILKALEHRARTRGWNRLVLETGNRQPDAIRFYTREGYSKIPNFGLYAVSEHSLCFGREI